MLRRPLLRRAVAWTERLLHAGQREASAPPGSAPPGTPAPAATVAAAAAGPRPPAPVAESPPVPLEAHHREGLRMAAAHRWNWAQRELDLAARTAPEGPAAQDLASVRDVRRQLRVLQKWPRDAQAHLALGRAYFELGLGADAEQALRQAIALAPAEPAGHLLLALEYAYRGELAAAERRYAEAQARSAGLPPFAALLADLQAAPAEASGAAPVPPPDAPGM